MLGFFPVNKRLQALLEKNLDLAQETEELKKVWSDVNQQRLNSLQLAYDRVRENLGRIPNERGEGPYSVDNLKKGYADLNKAWYEAVELLNFPLLDAAEDAKLDKTTIANVALNVPAHDANH